MLIYIFVHAHLIYTKTENSISNSAQPFTQAPKVDFDLLNFGQNI